MEATTSLTKRLNHDGSIIQWQVVLRGHGVSAVWPIPTRYASHVRKNIK